MVDLLTASLCEWGYFKKEEKKQILILCIKFCYVDFNEACQEYFWGNISHCFVVQNPNSSRSYLYIIGFGQHLSLCWELLKYADGRTSSWWLLMYWRHRGARSSATIMLTWLWLQCHTDHTNVMYYTIQSMLQPLKSYLRGRRGKPFNFFVISGFIILWQSNYRYMWSVSINV